MAKWAIASNAAVGSEDSPGGRIGEELVAETINLVITNVTNGVHSGYNITAANYKVDGGVESGTGTNIWLPPAASSGFVWAANEHIAQVAFTDLGIAGDASNTVNAAVTLTAFTPEKSITFNAAIVERDDNPPVLSSEAARGLSLEARWNYNANQTVTVTALTSAATLSDVAAGSATSYTRKRISGTAPDNATTRLASFKFVAASGYHYLDTLNLPVFSNLNSGTGIPYGKAYSWSRDNGVYENGKLKEITFILRYTPPVGFGVLEKSSVSSFESLGHAFTIPTTIRQDTVATTNTISRVSYKSNSTNATGTERIKVFGVEGTKYSISVEKKINTDSVTTASSDGHYNFATRAFQTTPSPLETVVGKNGVSTHGVLIEASATSTRYDIIISSLTGGATLLSGVPKQSGDAKIIKHGVNTLTIKPITNTPANFGALPSNVTTTMLIGFENDGYTGDNVGVVATVGGTGGSSSTRLVLEENKNNSRIAVGMVVMGKAIAHGTTVNKVNGKVVTLSTASAVAANTKIKFAKNTTSLVPFSFTIVPNGNTLNVNADADLFGAFAGVGATTELTNGAVSNNSTVTLDSTKGILQGMSVSGSEVRSTASAGLTVSSVTNGTTLVLSEAQYFSDNTSLTFSGDGGGGVLRSMQANKSEFTDATCDYNNDPTITHDANPLIVVGLGVSGTGIPAAATVASINSPTSFELSAATTGGSVTNGTLTFSNIVITGYIGTVNGQVDAEARVYIDDLITVT
jgi:hypothetical protein